MIPRYDKSLRPEIFIEGHFFEASYLVSIFDYIILFDKLQ